MIYVRVTDLNDYLFCPRKVYLKRVLGLKEERGFEAIFGSLIHEIFDRLNECEEEIVYQIDDDYPFDYILNLYEDTAISIANEVINNFSEEIKELQVDRDYLLLKIKKHISEELWERAKNVYDAIQRYNEYGLLLWDKLEPKIYSELELLSDTLKMVGRIDRAEFYSERIVPVEIKSGRFSKSHLLQLHAYALLLKQNYPKYHIDWGVIYYTSSKRKKEVKFSNKLYDKVISLRDEILKIIESETDPGPCSNFNKCKKCALREYCKKLNTSKN
jgi:CRISPR-associated protein Cas4